MSEEAKKAEEVKKTEEVKKAEEVKKTEEVKKANTKIKEKTITVKKRKGYFILGNFRCDGKKYMKNKFLNDDISKDILDNLISKGVLEEREVIVDE